MPTNFRPHAAQADLRAAQAGRGAQRPGAAGGGPRRLGQARRQDGPGAGRCALYGIGVWRRRPDAKWRLSPQMLEARLAEQRAVLDDGRGAGQAGRPARLYHLLGAAAENRDQVDAFLARQADFKLVPWPGLWRAGFARIVPSRLGRRLQPTRCRSLPCAMAPTASSWRCWSGCAEPGVASRLWRPRRPGKKSCGATLL